ncbi:PIR protein [Plasmodium vivax]|uniref:VIR protein n=1 Tax=Plasmodium vivax TaxID=5855 RepID=A0A1G4ECI7_PLAVI|nr:PIR protein [Plasmodium vivax]VUZ99744.1 PIR protein [Plasmodium vivax]
MSNPADEELIEIPEIEFYNKLYAEVSDQPNIDHYLQGCGACKNFSKVKKFVFQLVRNYENYKKVHSRNNSYDKYCRFFKYWLYRERKMEFPKESHDLRNQWNMCIPCVWEKLENDIDNHKGKCDFKNENISYGFIKVKKALDEICSIKDKLKNNEENSDTEKCLHINSIKKYYLDDLLSNIGSISSNSLWNDEYFKIDETCSLKKIYDLLQENQCPPKDITQRMEMNQCKAPASETKLDCTKESCRNLAQLCQENYPTQSCNNLDNLCEEHCKSKTFEHMVKQCPNVCSEQPQNLASMNPEEPKNPAKNPYLQLPVTVFSSVVGTIFFFLFLYKFTPFRSWFLNRIGSKKTLKHKIKQDIEREFLGAPFQPPYRDDQNSRPRVGYSQN